jgi:hypothetical protein
MFEAVGAGGCRPGRRRMSGSIRGMETEGYGLNGGGRVGAVSETGDSVA